MGSTQSTWGPISQRKLERMSNGYNAQFGESLQSALASMETEDGSTPMAMSGGRRRGGGDDGVAAMGISPMNIPDTPQNTPSQSWASQASPARHGHRGRPILCLHRSKRRLQRFT